MIKRWTRGSLYLLLTWTILLFLAGGFDPIAFSGASMAQASETQAEGQTKNRRVIYRKTQDVEFDGSPVDGVVRSPDGAYLSQRRGINFSPLYELRDRFDKNIKESVNYLR